MEPDGLDLTDPTVWKEENLPVIAKQLGCRTEPVPPEILNGLGRLMEKVADARTTQYLPALAVNAVRRSLTR